jgi:hypothetical protein
MERSLFEPIRSVADPPVASNQYPAQKTAGAAWEKAFETRGRLISFYTCANDSPWH